MRRTLPFVCLVVVVGCESGPAPKQIWLDQYRGLRAIPDATMARSMLANVCESAAFSGDGAAVVMMLRDLEDEPQRHDELAARCASHLYGHDAEAARRVVGKIGDRTLQAATRDKLFGKKDDAAKGGEKTKAKV